MTKKIYTKDYLVGEIPILEIYREQNHSELPLLFLYHGWTSCKEDMLDIAKQLSASNYRIIMADCYGHGARKKQELKMWDIDLMFQTIMKTVDEFPILFDYYRTSSPQQMDRSQFAVAGISMGAMIVNALMYKFDYIPAAVSLMGAAFLQDLVKHFQIDGMRSLVDASQFFYPEQPLPNTTSLDRMTRQKEQALTDLQRQLAEYDLGQDIRRLKQRIMYFWHAKQDPLVPCRITEDFEQKSRAYPEARNLIFSYDQKQGHLVPLRELKRVTDFLLYLKNIHFDQKLFHKTEALSAIRS